MNFSLREIARISGIAASTIFRIENGRLSPTLVIATKLATALELEPPTADQSSALRRTASEPSAHVVVHRKLEHTVLREGIRRDLSRIAARNGYEMAILLRGSLELRTNDGYRETLRPGAIIYCNLVPKHTCFALLAEEAELLWIT
ncbi:hypothetical protein AA309_11350 [Microvirga vignae]|uniref:HTH cro/C1-type domain-containing protein n=2 Tax=Microvirga vignae TaxID=1225564 RepID=A0A0H1RCR6_9HYPH|nr:hypothetical protein AA309_11350 [Microvirga vignae]